MKYIELKLFKDGNLKETLGYKFDDSADNVEIYDSILKEMTYYLNYSWEYDRVSENYFKEKYEKNE
jgi:hypothetical protein